MFVTSLPLPSICITPATPQENRPNLFSPFPGPFANSDVEDDRYRANWLLLPPSIASSPWYSSPLRSADGHGPSHKGLGRDQFSSLLEVSREQRAKISSQKVPDLCEELTLKGQNKQLERRAHFLSKVTEPPCTATIPSVLVELPTTAPCSISPCRSDVHGIVADDLIAVNSHASPDRNEGLARGLLAEQPPANFKFRPATQKKSRCIPPSLDEITARLSFPQQLIRRQQHAGPCNLTLESRPTLISHTVDVAARPTSYPSRADTARDMIVTIKRRTSPPPDLGTSTAVKGFTALSELPRCGRIGFA